MRNYRQLVRNGSQEESAPSRIIREATKLFFERGYHATSIEDITQSAGVSKGAFYWHFKSKEELLRKLLEEWERRFLDGLIRSVGEVKGNVVQKLQEVNRYTSAFAVRNRELCISFDTLSGELVGSDGAMEKEFRRVYARYQDFLAKLIDQGKKEKDLRAELDSHITALIIMSFHHGLLFQWSMNRDTLDGKLFMATYRSILGNGIFVADNDALRRRKQGIGKGKS